MSTLVLAAHNRKTAPLRTALGGFARQRRLIAGFAIGFPVFFYLILLAVLAVRYGHLPNYVTPYNWPANIWRIIVSTNSIADMVPIIGHEWLVETGYMNYDYGLGVAEWSLSIVPHKLILLAFAGSLIGLNVALLAELQGGRLAQQCLHAGRSGLLTSAGTFGAGVTNTSVFATAHCATPSWIGSLAVFGFDSYDLFAIEPYGSIICAAGLAALAASALLTIGGDRFPPAGISLSSRDELAPC